MTREQMEALGMSEAAIEAMLVALNTTKPLRRLHANKTIEFDGRYISESKEVMELLELEMKHTRDWSNKGKSLLLKAVVGTGKTYTLVEMAKRLNLKMIITVPNVSTATSNAEEYGVVAAYELNPIRDLVNNGEQIIFSTLDQARALREFDKKDLLGEYVLVVDEAHTLIVNAGFKHLAFESFEILWKEKIFKNIIFCTATPLCLINTISLGVKDILDFSILNVKSKKLPINFDLTIHTLGHEAKQRVDRKLNQVDRIVEDAKGKVLVYINDKKAQEAFNRQKNYDFVNADLKDTDLYKAITSAPFTVPNTVEKVLLTTDLFTAGNNIMNPNGEWTDIVVVDDCIPEQLFQIAGRFRKNTKTNIHLICNADGSEDQLNQERSLFIETFNETREMLVGTTENSLVGDNKGYVYGMFTRGLSGTEIVPSELGLAREQLKLTTRLMPTQGGEYFERLKQDYPNNVTISYNEIDGQRMDLEPYTEIKDEIADEIAEEMEVDYDYVKEAFIELVEVTDVDDREELVNLKLEVVNTGTQKALKKLLHTDKYGIIVSDENIIDVVKFLVDNDYRNEATARAYRTFIQRKHTKLTKFEDLLFKVLKCKKKTVIISELGISKHYWTKHLKPIVKEIYRHKEDVKVGDEVITNVVNLGRFSEAYPKEVQLLALERVSKRTVKKTEG